MRKRVVATTLFLILVAACSASRQARPDLPAPEYEPSRAMPAASAAASAAEPSPESDGEDTEGGRGRKGVGSVEGAEVPKPALGESKGIDDDRYAAPAKPIDKETTANRKRSDKPEPAASPEAPPSPTVIPAPPATAPAR